MKWIKNIRSSSLWVYSGLIFALYNVFIVGKVGVVAIILQCFVIVFYFLSRICEAIEQLQSANTTIEKLQEEKTELKEYIKKLAKRIHKQRCALRDNWEIVEERIRNRPTWQNRSWFCYAIKKNKKVYEQQSSIQKLAEYLNEAALELESWNHQTMDDDTRKLTVKYRALTKQYIED